jgi:hypothetical protein
LATTLEDVEDSVKDLARAMHARASSSLWDREVRLQQRPFGVGEVCGVSVARHASDRIRSTAAFSDSFYEHFIDGTSAKRRSEKFAFRNSRFADKLAHLGSDR